MFNLSFEAKQMTFHNIVSNVKSIEIYVIRIIVFLLIYIELRRG